jgi:hypothetical protein
VEASRKANADEAERECTFQPRIQNQVPTYMREIAAQQRMQRLAASTSEGWGGVGGDGPMDSVSGAIAAAASNRGGGLMSPVGRVVCVALRDAHWPALYREPMTRAFVASLSNRCRCLWCVVDPRRCRAA